MHFIKYEKGHHVSLIQKGHQKNFLEMQCINFILFLFLQHKDSKKFSAIIKNSVDKIQGILVLGSKNYCCVQCANSCA